MAEPSSIENSPGAQTGQPEGSGRPSAEKDNTQGSQPAAATVPETGPESTDSKTAPAATTAVATDEKDKQHAEGATTTSQTEDAAKATPPAYEPPTSDSTAASPPADQAITNVTTATGAAANGAPATQDPGPSPDPEKQPIGGPVDPGTDEPDPVLEEIAEETRRRTLIVHLRLAKFFNWLLLLAFVILPGTFSKENEAVSTKPLFAAVYVCTILNACAISWLWYQRRGDPEFLYLNLFLPGLTNSVSGLITTLVNLWAVRKGHLGAATTTTIVVTCLATAIYGVACVNFRSRHLSAQQARLNRGIYV
ncbi:hypothetical protein BC826DRAFT_1017832 [Russula brevipes]|nr:hypothetical protein BC826DRAFT_1017832 [Russula brevipes]